MKETERCAFCKEYVFTEDEYYEFPDHKPMRWSGCVSLVGGPKGQYDAMSAAQHWEGEILLCTDCKHWLIERLQAAVDGKAMEEVPA